MLIVECIIACLLFTILILPPLYKNPISVIMSYPTAIRKRVESLPEYKSVINKHKKRHISIKIIASIAFIFIMASVAWFSNARTFKDAFFNSFIIMMAINIYDLLILDIGLFCHNKRFIIPGTEDMITHYKSPVHHLKGALIGTIISFIVSFGAGSLVIFINRII